MNFFIGRMLKSGGKYNNSWLPGACNKAQFELPLTEMILVIIQIKISVSC